MGQLALSAGVGIVSGAIDGTESSGLDGTHDSLGYRVAEIERHLHSNESWLGAAVTPSGETHRADRVGTSVTAFSIDGGGGGGGSWGSWVQIVGSSDTPCRTGMVRFDFHKLFITAVERASTVHFIQIGFGDSGAAALAADTYTELVYRSGAAVQREAPVIFQTRRQLAGVKVWARCWAVGNDTGTLGFFIGLHEYEG